MSGPPPWTTIGFRPDVLEQHDVAREVLAQRRVGHRRPAVLDDDRPAVELPDVRERLQQRGDVARRRASRRVLRVDRHVLVREVGEEHLGLGALAGQADRVLDLLPRDRGGERRARRRAPPRRRRRPACPRSRCPAAAARASCSALPTACAIRPQFGSPPCSAALTSGESATARAARDHVRLVAAVDDHAADALGALAVAHDQHRQPPQQVVERLAEAHLVLGLGRDAHARSRRRPSGSRCRWWRAGRRRRCGRRSA